VGYCDFCAHPTSLTQFSVSRENTHELSEYLQSYKDDNKTLGHQQQHSSDTHGGQGNEAMERRSPIEALLQQSIGGSDGPLASCPFCSLQERVTKSKVWTARGRAKAPDLAPLDLTLGLPTFLGNDLEAMRTAARQNLELFTTFPFFQRLFRAMGYTDEAALMERGWARIRSATGSWTQSACL
jgi:hypothetical protein